MTLDELYPALRELRHTEKLRAIQFLAQELEKEESLIAEGEYPIWTPFGAFEAARILQDALEAEKRTNHG